MNCTAWTEKLHDYVDAADTLSAADHRSLEHHLEACAACRAELESLRRLRAATFALPRELPPARDLWPQISAQLEVGPALRPELPSPLQPFISSLSRFTLPLAIAATVALLCTFVARRQHAPPPRHDAPAWSVASLAGAPRVAARPVRHETPFRVGQWLETDATSRARVAVGSIGEVRVEPNSRVRLAAAAAHDHRIELARGTLDALIWAPPRLFFVDTPSATAVDLGCAYTLTVDDAGDGELHVTAGYVALEHGDREAIIPSGLKCLTRRGAGPGTPFAADAPPALRAALEAFDFGSAAARPAAFQRALALARPEDDVTLWHLLARTEGRDRAAVYDLLAKFRAPPAEVTRDGILAGDTAMRRVWGAALGLGSF